MTERIGIDLIANFSELDDGFNHSQKRIDEFGATARKTASEIGSSAQKMSDSLEMSAKSTQAALRMVPAQMTDIVTQLMGGQSPFLVLIQQGGQLKDMFGGIVPSIQAITTYVGGLISPFTLAASAAGLLTYAFIEGRGEASEFTKTLIVSGNAAGTNAAQMQAMADRVAASSGATHSAAAAALNALAATGNVSADTMERSAKAALELERVGGAAVGETVKEFAALGGDPVNAVLRLNDQYHFLTGSIYEQIKAMAESGRTSEAATLAIETYAGTIESRVPALAGNLGVLSKAWIELKDVAKQAWDAMVGFGREGSIDAQIATLKKQIEAREKASKEVIGPDGYESWRPSESSLQSDGVDALKKQLALLESNKTTQTKLAEETQRENTEREAGLFISQKMEESLTKQQKLKRAIDAIETNAAAAHTPKDVVDSLIAAEREKYKEKSGPKGVDYTKLMSSLSGLDANYQGELDALYQAYQRGTLGIDEYRSAVERLIERQPFAVKAAQEEKKALEEKLRIFDLTTRAEDQASKAQVDFETQAANRIELINRQVELLGKTPDEAQQINAFADIDRQSEALLRKLQELRANLAVRGGDTTMLDDLIAKLPQLADLAKGEAATALDRLREAEDRLNASFDYGSGEALRKYLDEVKNVASQSEAMWTSAFHGMDDALTDFVVKGKGDFSSLAESIISDLVRMQIQANITGPLAAAMNESGGLGGLISGLFSTTASGTGAGTAAAGSLWGAQIAHSGAIAGTGEGDGTRSVDPGVFRSAPRLHSGGIADDEVPAILKRGEGVFTEGQMKALGSGGSASVTVNLIESPGSKKNGTVSTSDQGGKTVLDVFVEQIKGEFVQDIASGGVFASAMEGQYALNRAAGAWR